MHSFQRQKSALINVSLFLVLFIDRMVTSNCLAFESPIILTNVIFLFNLVFLETLSIKG